MEPSGMEPRQHVLMCRERSTWPCWLMAALLWLLGSAMPLSAQPVVLDEASSCTDITAHLQIYTDPSNQVDIRTLLTPAYQHQFMPLKRARLWLNRPDATTWIKFEIAPGDPHQPNRLLHLGHASLSEATLFAVDGSGKIINPRSVDPTFDDSDSRAALKQVFLIKPVSQSTTYYLRLHHPLPIALDPTIWVPNALLQKIEWFQWMSGTFFGLMTAVILFNLLMFFANREPANLYYGAFLLSMTLLQALIDGKFFNLVPIDAKWLGKSAILAVLLTNYTALRFARVFLLQDAHEGRWSRLNRLGEWIVILAALSALFLSNIVLLYQLALACSALFTLFLLLLSLYRAQQGYRPALYYFCGRMLLLPVLLMMILHALGGTDIQILAGKGVMGVAAIEGIILSLALLHRIRLMEQWHLAERHQDERRQVEIRARHELIAKITQELRDPLSGIHGMSELLIDADLGKDEKNQARTIHQAAEKAIYLVDRAQNTVGLESDTLQIHVDEFDLQQLLDEVVAQARLIADPQRITLTVALDPRLAETAQGDPRRIKQALVELVSNAIAAIHAGEVRIGVEALSESPGLRFTVSDQGPGIPEPIQQLLDLPLHRMLVELESREQGGLGLPIVKWLVTGMGGQLSFVSHAGRGSSISFTLPSPELLPVSSSTAADGIRLSGQRILIVEGNETIRDTLLIRCRRWGMDALAASNSNQAIALIRDQGHLGKGFDFLLLEQESTPLSGLELALKINQEGLSPSPVMILLLGFGAAPTSERLRHAGIAKVLTKPIHGAQLQRLLGDLLPRKAIESTSHSPDADSRVLIFERDPATLDHLRKLFLKLKVSVEGVSERSSLLQRIKQTHYDLILIHHEPPLLDALDLGQRIRAWELQSNRLPTPLVVIDGPDRPESDWQASGINARLEPPFELEPLRRLMAQWCGD